MAWEKGESGNPKGRPKKTFKDYVEKWSPKIRKTLTDDNGKVYEMSAKEWNVVCLMKMIQNDETPPAIKLQAIRLFLEYTEGKPQPEVVSNVTVQNVQESTRSSLNQIKKSLDKLTPEERQSYFELCEKLDADTNEE